MDNERAIKKNLATIGEDYDTISDSLKKYLVSIQDIVNRKVEEQCVAIKTLQDSDLSVSSVCSELNISRNTAYRYNGLLRRYIESCSDQLADSNPLVIVERLKNENAEKQKQIYLMLDRDIDILSLKSTINQRDRLLQNNKQLIEQKSNRIMELTKDCLQLRIALEQSNPKHPLIVFQQK